MIWEIFTQMNIIWSLGFWRLHTDPWDPLNTFESREHSDKVTNSLSLEFSGVLSIIGFLWTRVDKTNVWYCTLTKKIIISISFHWKSFSCKSLHVWLFIVFEGSEFGIKGN